MKKNKKELFDKETLEMFESINKASIEETKNIKKKKNDVIFCYLIPSIMMILAFIIANLICM